METQDKIVEISFKNLRMDDENNCRGKIDVSTLTSLADNILKNGLIQYPLARNRWKNETFEEEYVLVAGYCRSHAVRDLLRLPSITCVVREMDAQQVIVANLAENIERKNLNIMQECEPLRKLMRMGITEREELKKLLGVKDGWLQPRMFLLLLPDTVQKIAAQGYLTSVNVRDLYSLKNSEEQIAAARAVKEKKQLENIKGPKEIRVLELSKTGRRIKANMSRIRRKGEINNLLEYLQSIDYDNVVMKKALAWVAGNIPEIELLAAIQTELNAKGIQYFPPREGIPVMRVSNE